MTSDMKEKRPARTGWSRRGLLAGAGGVAFGLAVPLPAGASPAQVDEAIREMFGNGPVREGRVTLTLPPIAENGNSVAVGISVDSPMSRNDHVVRIGLFSPRNPVALLGAFSLGPACGLAQVSTRVRLAGTQSLRAVAQMNDGTLWSGKASTYVTLAACIIG